jgi:hemerythrin-like metal-binding protein
MVYAKWDASLATGNKRIDDDHKRLINLINTLHHAMSSGRGNAILSTLLVELQEYSIAHFTREEFVMDGGKYAGLDMHMKEHQFFIDKVRTYVIDFQCGRIALTPSIMDFLREWLFHHIHISDVTAFSAIRAKSEERAGA